MRRLARKRADDALPHTLSLNSMFDLLVTHSGLFHADDVFAAATLRTLAPDAPIKRTRDAARLATYITDAKIAVFDVGDRFDPALHCFDHHQRDFTHTRQNSPVPYASFGLVWSTHGSDCCRVLLTETNHILEDEATLLAVWQHVEERLVWAVDAADCGALLYQAHLKDAPHIELSLTPLSRLIGLYNPQRGGPYDPAEADAAFGRAVDVARVVLAAQVQGALAFIEAERAVARADDGGPILRLEHYVRWQEHVRAHHRLVLSPSLDGSGWMVEVVQDDFVPRAPLPAAWGGLRSEELELASGVKGAMFCHRALFIAAASNEQGARQMAHAALDHGASAAQPSSSTR